MKPSSATPYISQSSPEGFFWDSRLTLGRKQEIAKWIGTLKPADRLILCDIIEDAEKSTAFDVRSEYEGRG